MDPGYRSPIIDFFLRGEVGDDLRLLAARGALVPSVLEQMALLVLLVDDAEPSVAAAAAETLNRLPRPALLAFLAGPEVPDAMRAFFAARGIELPERRAAPPAGSAGPAAEEEEGDVDPQVLSTLPIIDRMKLAMKGTRAQRATLVRDSNKLVAAAVLSSPKLTETEVEAFSKMANVSEDVLRIIANNRAWTKNYVIVAALARNPKTPPALSMPLVQRLNERDLKALSIDRNVPEGVRLAARKFVVKSLK
jgi:hypothetical protein